ncbi:MAG: cytochrome c3 family protein [Candidatus Aminicenantales bacterium]
MKRKRRNSYCLLMILVAVFAFIIFTSVKTEALIPSHQCDYCHNMHAAKDPPLLPEIEAENTCLTCHSPGGSSSLKAAVHEYSSYGGFRQTCLDCHDPHNNQQNNLGSYNLKLVLASVSTPNSGLREVVFISRGRDVGDPEQYSFADGDDNYDGICEVCHTQTKHHRNNSTGKHQHNKGRTCTLSNCHSHINGFIKN